MTKELHTHCQCDNCTGEDCGQDNPEEYEREQAKELADIRQAERGKVLGGRKLYRCNSDTCSDSGGTCILCVPDMDFEAPTSCVNPDSFTDNGDEPDCKWEELRQQAGEP
jgi:hypothetical protein